ncbi:MAG TPA: hypothetical protein VF400_01830 [Anaeromyxobacteraceae bacterium]
MKKLALLLALTPVLALARGAPGSNPDPGPGARGMDPDSAQRMQKRMHLALTLGLAEALDLSAAQALAVHEQVEKMTPRRAAVHQQLRDATQVLRRSAKGEKVPAGDVDRAVTSLLDGRAQLQAIDRELVTTVTKGQPPEKRARAVLFLARFHQRVVQGFGGTRHRMDGGVMGPGGHGPGGHGMGHGGPGEGPGPGGHGGADPGPLGMADDGAWDDGVVDGEP